MKIAILDCIYSLLNYEPLFDTLVQSNVTKLIDEYYRTHVKRNFIVKIEDIQFKCMDLYELLYSYDEHIVHLGNSNFKSVVSLLQPVYFSKFICRNNSKVIKRALKICINLSIHEEICYFLVQMKVLSNIVCLNDYEIYGVNLVDVLEYCLILVYSELLCI